VDYSAVPNNPNQTPLTILCNNNLPTNPSFFSFHMLENLKGLAFFSTSIQKWPQKCKKPMLHIPVTSNWNWYMGGFFGILCMIIHGSFQSQFQK
jgi:hypothetical protein